MGRKQGDMAAISGIRGDSAGARGMKCDHMATVNGILMGPFNGVQVVFNRGGYG